MTLPATAQTTRDNVGFTRFAHTAVDVGPIDIYIGANTKPFVTNLKYGDVTDFISLPDTLSGYIARAAGSSADSPPLFKLAWGVKANKSEMITAAGLNSHKAFLLEPMTLVRNNTKGKARVRVYDTVWGGALLNVDTTQGMNFSQNQQYLNPSSDKDVAPGVYDFEVKDGTGKVLSTAPGIKLEADKVYVMLIIGGAAGNPPIKLLPIVNDEEVTRIQFVNKSDKAVDVYIKGDIKPLVVELATGSTVLDKELAFVATQMFPGRDLVMTINSSGGVQISVTSNALTPLTTATTQATFMATMQGTLATTVVQ